MQEKIEFVRGSVKQPEATREFEDTLKSAPRIQGKIIYGYPLGQSHKGGMTAPDAVYVAPNGHICIVHMVQGEIPEDFREHQDDLWMAVDRKLRASGEMRNGRKMRVSPQTLTFAPDAPDSNLSDPQYPTVNRAGLAGAIRTFQERGTEGLDGEQVYNTLITTNSDTGFW